jgi:hypothetical protein
MTTATAIALTAFILAAAGLIIWGTHTRMPRLRTRGRHHADSLGLVFDPAAGRLRHAETGPLRIAPDYGTAPPWNSPRGEHPYPQRPAPAAPGAGPRTTSGPGGPVTAPAGSRRPNGQQPARGTRVVTRAGPRSPVFVAGGAAQVPMRPEPAPEPSGSTATLARLTETGEIRLRGEQYRKGMRAREAAHRLDMRREGLRAIAGGSGQ